jgi:histone acetyltransferase
LTKKLKAIWKIVKDKEIYSWPFLYPVDKKEVPDYYEIIKEPMDLETISIRLNRKFYRTIDIFTSDFRRMFDNCRVYNSPNTEYYKYAEKLEAIFKEEMRKIFKK